MKLTLFFSNGTMKITGKIAISNKSCVQRHKIPRESLERLKKRRVRVSLYSLRYFLSQIRSCRFWQRTRRRWGSHRVRRGMRRKKKRSKKEKRRKVADLDDEDHDEVCHGLWRSRAKCGIPWWWRSVNWTSRRWYRSDPPRDCRDSADASFYS